MPRSGTAVRHREPCEPRESHPSPQDSRSGVVQESERLRRLGIIDANGNLRIPIAPTAADEGSDAEE
jgi:hypothetical protein